MSAITMSGERRRQDQADRRGQDVERALGEDLRARLAKAFREDQPARTQVLDGDLAGVFLVDRARWSKVTPLKLDLEQLVHRQAAARVAQADDHPVDVAAVTDVRDVLDRADDAGIEQGRADLGRIRIDEADDLHAQFRLALVDLLGQGHGRRVVPMSSSRSPGRTCAVAHWNSTRESRMATMTNAVVSRNTPRPTMSDGNQK